MKRRNERRSARPRRTWLQAIVLLVLALGLGDGCAYFNTLYHARQNYREAEEQRARVPEGPVSEATRELYLKAAKKCAKVITEHPKSRWVDDAILLMGKCFYEREEYEKAEKKFEDVLRLFPQSNLVREATYMRGMALFGLSRYADAREIFVTEKDVAKKDEERFRAWLMIGRTDLAADRARDAVILLQELAAWKGSEKNRDEAFFWLGEALAKSGQPDEALAAFRDAERRSKRSVFQKQVHIRIGEVLVQKGDQAEAARFFQELAARASDPTEEAKLQLRVAEAERGAGRVDAARATLERIVDLSPRSEQAAEAQYQLGLIQEMELRHYDEALATFDKVREISPGAEATRRASDERQKIIEFQRLQTTLAALDSTRTAERAQARFDLAEMLLLRMDDPEGALESYRACQTADPPGPNAPRALLAAAWVLDHPLKRSDEGTAALTELAAMYPNSPQAVRARSLLTERGAPLPAPTPIAMRAEATALGDTSVVPADTSVVPADTSTVRADTSTVPSGAIAAPADSSAAPRDLAPIIPEPVSAPPDSAGVPAPESAADSVRVPGSPPPEGG